MAFAAVLSIQDAALVRPDRSLALGSAHGRMGIGEVASQMRRFFGPMGGSRWRDSLLARDVEGEVSSFHEGGRLGCVD